MSSSFHFDHPYLTKNNRNVLTKLQQIENTTKNTFDIMFHSHTKDINNLVFENKTLRTIIKTQELKINSLQNQINNMNSRFDSFVQDLINMDKIESKRKLETTQQSQIHDEPVEKKFRSFDIIPMIKNNRYEFHSVENSEIALVYTTINLKKSYLINYCLLLEKLLGENKFTRFPIEFINNKDRLQGRILYYDTEKEKIIGTNSMRTLLTRTGVEKLIKTLASPKFSELNINKNVLNELEIFKDSLFDF